MEYRVKEKKSEVQLEAASKKSKADTVVQIGKIKVVVQDKGKEPMVIDKSATSSTPPIQKPFTANNHEASGSKVADKYHQPHWCPERLTHTQKRKLQCLRNKEKREQEAEKVRDEYFNKYRPMIPQGKVWQVKMVDQPVVGSVGPTLPTGQTALSRRSDWSSPVQRAQPNQWCLFRFLVLMKWNQLLQQRKTKSWWIMRRLRSATIWKLMLCICLRIIS